MTDAFLAGYRLRLGSQLDRALLVKFMQFTYQELFPEHGVNHLAHTVDQYLAPETPLWWVDSADFNSELDLNTETFSAKRVQRSPIACLWIGNAIDQIQGDRHAHIFLLYVVPSHRRRGVGSALMNHAENWAKQRGDRQMGLQVFHSNRPALQLYGKLGYQPQSIWMVKPLG